MSRGCQAGFGTCSMEPGRADGGGERQLRSPGTRIPSCSRTLRSAASALNARAGLAIMAPGATVARRAYRSRPREPNTIEFRLFQPEGDSNGPQLQPCLAAASGHPASCAGPGRRPSRLPARLASPTPARHRPGRSLQFSLRERRQRMRVSARLGPPTVTGEALPRAILVRHEAGRPVARLSMPERE